MSTKSKEYQALELLGPGDCKWSWAARISLAHFAARRAIEKQLTNIQEGASLAAVTWRLETIGQSEIPARCGIRIEVTIDADRSTVQVEAKQADESSLLCSYSAIATDKLN